MSQARHFVTTVLTKWDLPDAVDTVSLLTSELATNAVLHARTRFAVVVTRVGENLTIAVLDGSPVPPRQRRNSTTAATGRGVAMVAQLSTAWGATPPEELHGFAKGVWFTVPAVGAAESAWAGDWLGDL